MSALFSREELTPRPHRRPKDERRRRIPTGAPRLVESSIERDARLQSETWTELLAAIRRSARARLELYKKLEPSVMIPCPWAQVVACGPGCRCGGTRVVNVVLLREHYDQLPAAIMRAVRRPS